MPETRRAPEGAAAERSSTTVRNDFSGQAHQVVQVGSVGAFNLQTLPPVPVRPVRVVRLVPPSTGSFADRVQPLAWFGERMPNSPAHSRDNPQNPRLLVVWGRRGMGKSALLRRVAAQWGEQFPGGHLYVDYGPIHQRGGAVIEDVLVRILHRLNVEESFIPTDLDALIDLYRSVVAELPGPVLVAVDDVRAAQQVRSLVPNAPGCVVLVTADARLAELLMDGAQLLELERMAPAAGLDLLGSICGSDRLDQEPEAAAELVELCEGLPLALTVAGARLGSETSLRVRDLVDELRDERRRLDGLSLNGEPIVTAVLDTAYGDLPEAVRAMYRRLGQLPVTQFGLDVAAVASDTDQAAAKVILSALVERRLLEPLDAEWYRMHGLIRAHARDLVDSGDRLDPTNDADEEPDAVLRAVVDYYLRAAATADRTIIPQRLRFTPGSSPSAAVVPFALDPDAALAWLDRERVNLGAVQRAAAERGWHEPVWQLAESISALFLHRRYLPDWYATGTLGAAAAEQAGRSDAAARLWSLTSRPMADLGRLDEARTASLRALELAQVAADSMPDLRRSQELLASVWEFRGRVLDHDDPAAAVPAYRRSQQLNRQAGQARGEALATFFLGRSLDAVGEHDSAISTLDAALAAFDESGERRMRARVQAALGVAQAHQGALEPAVASLRTAITELADLGVWSYQAQALDDLAEIEQQRGADDDATALRERARLIRERLGGAANG